MKKTKPTVKAPAGPNTPISVLLDKLAELETRLVAVETKSVGEGDCQIRDLAIGTKFLFCRAEYMLIDAGSHLVTNIDTAWALEVSSFKLTDFHPNTKVARI